MVVFPNPNLYEGHFRYLQTTFTQLLIYLNLLKMLGKGQNYSLQMMMSILYIYYGTK